MNGQPTRLDRTIELVLTAGVVGSGMLLLAGLVAGRSALLRAGIVLLMLTPVARVVVLTAALFRQKDWLFAFISLWILSVLVSSLYVASRVSRAHTGTRARDAVAEGGSP